MTDQWWRNEWMKAVYASDLRPMARFVAMIYADHARDQRTAWVALNVLVERTGLGRTQAKKWRAVLVSEGWLVEFEKARQWQTTRYLLNIPEGRMPDRLEESRGSDARPSEPAQGVGFEVQGVGFDASGGRLPDPNQSSRAIQHQSSSSPARTTAARLLGWSEEDERLALIDDFLKANNVKSARSWLEACHRNGDLERNYLAFIEEQKATSVFGDFSWESVDRGPDIYTLQDRVKANFENEQQALDAADYEAMAMGLHDGDPWHNRAVLRNLVTSIEHQKKWARSAS